MPTTPQNVNLKATGADILNAIRNNASVNYRDYVPTADNSLDSIRTVGNIIMDMPALQNEFITSLVNRIARVMILSKSYDNPWKVLKKGLLEFGETVEEIFINLANPQNFDPNRAESEVFKREIPDVRAAFHVLNYQKFYKTTVSREQLRQAFLSSDGLFNLVEKITEALYTGMNYDEFLVMKYLIARSILNGRMKVVTIPAASAENSNAVVTAVKATSDEMTFMKTDYNPTGVYTYTDKENQYVIVNTAFNAIMDVNTLASAFNMDKAEFAGHRILTDGFGSLDNERLAKLFEGDSNYTAITTAEMNALNQIPAVLIDRDWMMIFDNLLQMEDMRNGQGLYWNYYLHAWKTFSVSPFANSAVFVPGTPTVTSVTVSPTTATVAAGQSVSLTPKVVTTNFAPETVDYTLDNTTKASVSPQGVVTIAADAASGTKYKVTVASTFNTSKTATVNITVA